MAWAVISIYPNQPVGTVGLGYYSLFCQLTKDATAASLQCISLPKGLSCIPGTNGNYYFSGTPTARGSYTFTAKVVANLGGAVLLDLGTFTIVVVSGHLFRKSTGHLARKSSNGHLITGIGSSSTPSITTDALPNVVYGQAYNVLLAASGGSLPYTWSVVSGSFPAGLYLSSSGIISGSSTAAPATYTVTIRCADTAGQSGTRTFVFFMMANTSNVAFTLESNNYYGAYNAIQVYDPAGYAYSANSQNESPRADWWPFPGQTMPIGGGKIYWDPSWSDWPEEISPNGGRISFAPPTYIPVQVLWSPSSPTGIYKFWVERTEDASMGATSFRYRIWTNGTLFWERTGAGTAAYSASRRYTQLWTFNTSTGVVS